MTALRVIFMGTPDFAVPALKALIDSEHEVVAVYSQPPRPAGRGQKLTPSPIHQLAELQGIPVLTPVSLKPAEVQEELRAHKADVALVAAYGLLLPQAVLDAPKYGCINIHPSTLPRWRGAAPIQRTVMAGDTKTSCCIMQMEAGLDTGPVLMRGDMDMPENMTAGEVHDAMAIMGAVLALRTLDSIETLKPVPQDEDGVTYAAKITKADQPIDWSRTAREIHNQVRGLAPSPCATFTWNGETLKLCKSEVAEGKGTPGTLLNDNGLVACGSGALRILELQRAGKQRVAIGDFLRGQKLPKGTVLG